MPGNEQNGAGGSKGGTLGEVQLLQNSKSVCLVAKHDCPKELTKSNVGQFLKTVERKISAFEKYTSAINNQDELKEEIKLDLLFAAIPESFKNSYGDELFDATDADDLKKKVKGIIGVVSAEEAAHLSKIKFQSMARRTQADESFVTYLGRLKSAAKGVEGNSDVQDYLVREKFRLSLGPSLLDFIRIHGDGTFDTEKAAELLDKKGQHISRPDVQVLQVNKQMAEMELKLEKALSQISEQGQRLKERDRELEELKRGWARTEINKVDGVGSKPRGGRKVRCEECGLFNHKTVDCRGCKLTCYVCGKVGHTQHAVKHHPHLN